MTNGFDWGAPFRDGMLGPGARNIQAALGNLPWTQTSPEQGVAPTGGGIPAGYEDAVRQFLDAYIQKYGNQFAEGWIIVGADGKYSIRVNGVETPASEYFHSQGISNIDFQNWTMDYGLDYGMAPTGDAGYEEWMAAQQEQEEWEKQQWWYEQQAMSPYQQEQLGMQGYYAPYDIASQGYQDQMDYTQMMMELQRSPLHWPSMWSITRGGPEIEGQPISLPQPYWGGWQGGMPPAYESQYQQPVWGDVPWATEPEPQPQPTPQPSGLPLWSETPHQLITGQLPPQPPAPNVYPPPGWSPTGQTQQQYWGGLSPEQRTGYMQQYGTLQDWRKRTGGTGVEYAEWIAKQAGVLPGSR